MHEIKAEIGRSVPTSGPGHMVTSMVEFGVAILVLLSAGIFLAHAIDATGRKRGT
jgi:hypothetical protein